jgi:hypothetical protein
VILIAQTIGRTKAPIYLHISVREDLVSSGGDNAIAVLASPGRHKTGPYDVVVGKEGSE